jgi:hypothetical protein
MKGYPGVALSLIVSLAGTSPAEGAPAPAAPAKVSAPVVYEDLMLIVAAKEGVAAVVFVKDLPNGAAYRYRFLPKDGGKEQTGEGKVLEKYERVPTKGPQGRVVTGAVDKGSRLVIEAGLIKLEWSYSAKGRGWVYYRPEEVRVQIGNARDLATCDLRRFAK